MFLHDIGFDKFNVACEDDIVVQYKKTCSEFKPTELLGKVQMFRPNVDDNDEVLLVANLFGQLTYGKDPSVVYTNKFALGSALRKVNERYPLRDIWIPDGIGCGLANGNWEEVQQIIRAVFNNKSIGDVYICKKVK
jgi:hypothetical protein